LFTVHVHDAHLTPTREAWQTGTPLGDNHLKEEVDAMLRREIGQTRRGRPKKTPSNIL